jgi:hypothetical protein
LGTRRHSGRHATTRINGPILPAAGPVYRVVYGQDVTSNPATLALCVGLANEYNGRHGKSLAYVDHIERSSHETTTEEVIHMTNPNPVTKEQLAAMLDEGPGDGFRDHSSDIVGTWESETEDGKPNRGITFVPAFVTMGDSKKYDKTKPSILIFGRLTKPCVLMNNGDEVVGQIGELAGVWYKPGMKDVRDAGGIETYIRRNPAKDKDIDRGNEMKGFDVLTLDNRSGFILPIREDRRIESAHRKTVFDPPGTAPQTEPSPKTGAGQGNDTGAGQGNDNVPF